MPDSSHKSLQVAVGDICHWCHGAKVFRGQSCERCNGTGKIQTTKGWWSQIAGYRETSRD